MDGSCSVLTLSEDCTAVESTTAFSDHSKFVVCARWSNDGNMFATGSHDKTLKLYRRQAGGEFALHETLRFNNVIESLDFIYEAATLVVAVRAEPYLHYIDLATMTRTRVNVNGNDWDTHCSFTVLDIVVNPANPRYLLAATDKSRVIVFGENGSAVRNLYGHKADEYANASIAWSCDGKHVFSNSQSPHNVFCWDASSENVVATLEGHTNVVRSIAHHPSQDLLASVSFDKSIRTWAVNR
jgi:COMPASS component SWD3